MSTIDIGIIIALIGCFVGLAGWLMGRDKKISNDAEWRGTINAKLDVVVGIKSDVEKLTTRVDEHSIQLATIDASAKQAHHRIDEISDKLSNK